jgi:uncharacterized protein
MWFGGAFCVLDVSPRVYIVSIYTELRLLMIDFGKITGFEWDEGNRDKKWDNHKVAWWEIEETFFVGAPDPSHSDQESPFYALGRTKGRRLLQIVFIIRGTKIRPISARNMSRKERKVYGQAAKESADL